MKRSKILITFAIIGCLSTTADFDVLAKDFDYSPISELPQEVDARDYIKLFTEGTVYTVKPDDTLWSIADEKCGDGSMYTDLVEMNTETVKNPDIILPGETIMLPEYLYIPRSNTPNTEQENAYRIEYADIESHNYSLGANVQIGNTVLTNIYSKPTTNRMGLNALTNNWEDFVAEVERCSEEICGRRVTDLTFEKYRMEDGCDLCGYTFTLTMGDEVREVVVFYRLGEQNMAEIIGSGDKKKDSMLIDAVRYVAASFEDLSGEIDEKSETVESLTIDSGRPTENVDFLAQCSELEHLNIQGDGFRMLTDLTVLANCKELRRLYLQTPRVTDFSFLEECPQIDVIKLTGKRSDGQPSEVPGLELLPNARSVEFYGREIR